MSERDPIHGPAVIPPVKSGGVIADYVLDVVLQLDGRPVLGVELELAAISARIKCHLEGRPGFELNLESVRAELVELLEALAVATPRVAITHRSTPDP